MNALCGLAIEAATDQFSLAACRGGRSECWESRPARDETQRIYEHVERLLARLDANLSNLEFVAFGCGPGSFTGVRVAASAVQAIAFARGIPVCRASSLAVLAAGAARELHAEWIATCIDARMERAYVALYHAAPGHPPIAAVPDAWIDPREFVLPGAERFVAVGGGWTAYPDMLARHRSRVIASAPGLLPSARDLLSMAIADFHAGRTIAPHEAVPEYLGQQPAIPRPPAPSETRQQETLMLNDPRTLNTAGFLACVALMGYALYAQYGLGLEPCPLCIFQRVAVISLGVVFALARLHAPGRTGRRVYGVLLALAAAAGAGVSARHLWLQTLPPERVPACGPGLDYMLESFPFREMLQTVLSGSGECAQVDWRFLGMAMPAWVLISVVALGLGGIWNNWRRVPQGA